MPLTVLLTALILLALALVAGGWAVDGAGAGVGLGVRLAGNDTARDPAFSELPPQAPSIAPSNNTVTAFFA